MKKRETARCEFCGEKAGKSEFNTTGILCCQKCGEYLCDECAVYGFDNLPRCEECHSEFMRECDDCRGNKEAHNCEYCDYC